VSEEASRAAWEVAERIKEWEEKEEEKELQISVDIRLSDLIKGDRASDSSRN